MLTSLIYLALCASTSLAWLPDGSASCNDSDSQRWSNPHSSDPTNDRSHPHPPFSPRPYPHPPPSSWKMRGVNLGSQFIIEPWMSYDEFNSMGCGSQPDEFSCTQTLGQDAADVVFATHWDTWITQEDIIEIASFGLNTVRIPIGFWIKENVVQPDEFFPRGGLPYLDRLVGWCADAGLYVIMDLHAGPGGQTSDQEFTGHSVDYPGWFTPYNYERTLQFLEWMTQRIHTLPSYTSVGMLQVMNEPAQAYNHPDLAANMLQNFYPAALTRIRAAEDTLNIIRPKRLHVQYMSSAWGSGDPTTYLNTTDPFPAFDDHRYLKWDTTVPTTQPGYLASACSDSRGPTTIISEWSLAVADSISTSPDFDITEPTSDQKQWYQQYWAAQAAAYEKSLGWVFWTWKCNWIGGIDDWRWCYQSAVRSGVIPNDAGMAGKIASEVCGGVNQTISGGNAGGNKTVSTVELGALRRREMEHLRRHRVHGRSGLR